MTDQGDFQFTGDSFCNIIAEYVPLKPWNFENLCKRKISVKKKF